MAASRYHDYAIDLCKLIATLIVINSHMELCYPAQYQILATGGAIGNALFFFCSGFTLFLSSQRTDFFNWYSRRYVRIAPALIAIALVALAFGQHWDIWSVLTGIGHYWFIPCILVYYALLYVIKEYLSKHLWTLLALLSVAFLIAYFAYFWYRSQSLYGADGPKKVFYFLLMLYGGIMGRRGHEVTASKWSILWLLIWVVVWYGCVMVLTGTPYVVFSIAPLFMICYYSYAAGKCALWQRMMQRPVVGNLLYIVGALCLESYLVQRFVFTDKLNGWFPVNIPLIILAVLIAAYVLHILTEFIRQTFSNTKYDWRAMLLYAVPA